MKEYPGLCIYTPPINLVKVKPDSLPHKLLSADFSKPADQSNQFKRAWAANLKATQPPVALHQILHQFKGIKPSRTWQLEAAKKLIAVAFLFDPETRDPAVKQAIEQKLEQMTDNLSKVFKTHGRFVDLGLVTKLLCNAASACPQACASLAQDAPQATATTAVPPQMTLARCLTT